MNDTYLRHMSPFTHLLNVESRFLTERTRIFKIKDLIGLFAHVSFHIELCTSLSIKENNWNIVMMT